VNIVREEIHDLITKEVEKKTDPKVLSGEIRRFFLDARNLTSIDGRVNDAVHRLVTEEVKDSIERRVRECLDITDEWVTGKINKALKGIKVAI
jgi:hypothetical protein